MAKERYMTMLFCKIKESYFALDEKTRTELSHGHAGELKKYTPNINHLVTMGFNGKYDQVALIESDNMKEIYDAVEAFNLGAKGRHIEVIDTVFGIKVENKADFEMIGKR